MNELLSKLDEIRNNKQSLNTYIEHLELTSQKLQKLLDEMLESPVPENLKFSSRRINNINLLTQSLTKIHELLNKLRKDIHGITLDEVKLLIELELVQEKSDISAEDITNLWLKLSQKKFSTEQNS